MATGGEFVSIITPAYNAARFIEQTIASVQAQTYTNWELLVVDDGSRDRTAIILARLTASDSRIKITALHNNLGPAGARNIALARAKGRFIAFLDADDLWSPIKLERQLDFARMTNAALTFTAYRRVDECGERVGHLINIPPKMAYFDLLKNTAIATSTVIIDTLMTGPVSMKDVYLDDFACWLDLLRRGFIAHGICEDLMRYRAHAKSHSAHKMGSASHVWHVYRNIERLPHFASAWYFLHYAANAFVKHSKF